MFFVVILWEIMQEADRMRKVIQTRRKKAKEKKNGRNEYTNGKWKGGKKEERAKKTKKCINDRKIMRKNHRN